TFLALMGAIERYEDLQPGDPISIFAYGSGSCAEYYPATIGEKAKQRVQEAGLAQRIAQRYALSIEEYEAVETERTGYIDQPTYQPQNTGLQDHYKRFYEGNDYLVLRGLDGYFREYDWS
ncbi:MAG: hydroxymethylglutaryl-CoA synthase, partial [Myxococcota bacterium]